MTGDLLARYTEIASDDYYGVIPSFTGVQDGLLDLMRRLHRAMDEDAAARMEAEEACHLTASDGNKAAIMQAVERGILLCESPIEKLILPWLLAQKYPGFTYRPRLDTPLSGLSVDDLCVSVVPQVPFERYRADFALLARRGPHVKYVVVECDGKEWHSTEAQIAHDQKRDAYLTSRDDVLAVVRFTGSQIYQSPKQCAAAVAMRLYECWRKNNATLDHKFGG